MNTEHRPTPAPTRCRVCGAVLDSHRLGGLCPACLWQVVMEPGFEETEAAAALAGPSMLAIPGHTVVEEIARGGMGIIYRARQSEPKRTVALKMLLPQQAGSEEMRERFRLEARAIAALDHPAILPVYQVGEHDGLPYFTMKFAAGGTLATRGGQYRGQYRQIAELIATLADAIQFAHERGILHRDVKPGNILFDDTGRPYVSDFGLAKFLGTDAGLTESVRLLGTPNYLAPEVARRCARFATTASDLYSLGAVLYELLAGCPPFEAEGLPALLKKIVEEEPAPPSAVKPDGPAAPPIPRDLETICLKCIAKEPARRYASARDLAADLRRWLAGEPILAHPVSRRERMVRWAVRNPAVAILVLLLVLAVAGGGLTLARSNLKLQRALLQSLLTQARLERTSGRVEQRFQALALITRAIDLLPVSAARDDAQLAALRTEAVGALAVPDLRPLARWPVYMGAWGSAVGFTDDLARYAAPGPQGGFDVLATDSRRLLRHFPGTAANPAVEFKFSRDGQWVAAIFQDGHAELHALALNQPPRQWPGDAAARTDVEFLPDGPRVLVAAPQRGLVWHDLADGGSRTLIPPPTTVTALKPDPRGERLACFAQNTVQVLRLADGARTWALPLTNGISRPAWSPDGRYLAITESVQPFETTVFDLDSGRVVAHFQDHELGVSRMAFHPDGRSLASVSLDNRLVWRQLAQDGLRLIGQAGWRVLRFSKDGRRLAYEPGHGQVGLLEVVPSTVLCEWHRTTPPDDGACMIEVSPDGRLVATSAVRGVHLWDAATREEMAHLPLPRRAPFVPVFFHPAGGALLYSAPGIGVVEVELIRNEPRGGLGARDSDQGAARLEGQPPVSRRSVGFGASRRLGDGLNVMLQDIAPDRRSLVVTDADDKTGPGPRVWLWPDADPTRARPLTDGSALLAYHFTPDGRWGISSHLTEPDVVLWDPQSGRRLRSLGLPLAADAHPTLDARWILVTTRDQHQLWETGTWKPGPAWPHSLQRGNWAVAFSADGRWIATTTAEGRVEIRSLSQAKLLLELPPPQPLRLHDLDFSPDGQRLYLLQATGHLIEWNLAELRRELAARGLDWAD